VDPIHEDKGQWYYWDETWDWRTGPFDTEEEARADLARYCEFLDWRSKYGREEKINDKEK
jgi:hypothetical protein